jgi:hypothetical protein
MDPQEDGTKHINVTYNSKTPFGRMLSPPYQAEFEISKEGRFESVGGYWCWLLFGDERFRKASGENLLVGRSFEGAKAKTETDEFQKKVLKATWLKIRQNDKIFSRFEQNILPFHRYYIGESHIYKPSDAEWFCEGLDKMVEYIDKNFW